MNPAPSSSHLVLIPSYNSGTLVLRTVREALAQWAPVWVVVDGSTDGTDAELQALAATEPHLRVLMLPVNRGKERRYSTGCRRRVAKATRMP